MSPAKPQRLRSNGPHPYLSGNFAPIQSTWPLTPCSYHGQIPEELAGGEYVRNGGNPLTNEDLGRDAHWFDGDGMLSGVLFRRVNGDICPEFVNQFLLTDVFLNAKNNLNLRRPLLPSIATLVDPLASLFAVISTIFRTLILILLSHLPGSKHAVKRISVANTAVVYHDGRALATCESGPPLRFLLPGLETIGWFNGRKAGNETSFDSRPGFGGDSAISFMKEWTTGHPRIDPITKEFLSFHSVFIKPFVYYSIVPAIKSLSEKAPLLEPPASFDLPVPGVKSPKMMHDFGVSARHTIIMDLPLSLDPTNIVHGLPAVSYDTLGKARFGVFPRYEPQMIQWFETNPCVIFHAANCWDSTAKDLLKGPETVDLLVCRLTSASLVYSAGAVAAPVPTHPVPIHLAEEEQCRLYYYSFSLGSSQQEKAILHEWSLSAISFEFPSLEPSLAMRHARYIYGCSTGSASYSVALGKAAKIDYLSKIDAQTLIARGKANPPQKIKGCVDPRNVREILRSTDPNDPIKLFALPEGYFAQEPRFVPRRHAKSEDDGWLLTYVFDESQLDEHGVAAADSISELWIIDAIDMKDVVAKVQLPQRVPYGLHGSWFSEEEIQNQREYSGVRSAAEASAEPATGFWNWVRNSIERQVG